MKAYHGNQDTKDIYVERMKAHMAADELVRGIGFEDGKGCAVGCILNNYDHRAFETELGIPSWMAHLLDTLHENISDNVWPTYTLRFLEAIKPGVHLETVKAPFLIYILRHCKRIVGNLSISKKLEYKIQKSLNDCIELYKQPLNISAADNVRAYAADIAAAADTEYSVAVAANRTASIATYANAARIASTAHNAAGASTVIGDSTSDQAISDATSTAAIATVNPRYDLFAEKLIELIGNCEVQH